MAVLLGNLPVRENMMSALASSGDEGQPHGALGLSHNLYLGFQIQELFLLYDDKRVLSLSFN